MLITRKSVLQDQQQLLGKVDIVRQGLNKHTKPTQDTRISDFSLG